MQVVDRINHDQGRGAIRIGAAAAFELMPGRTVAWKGRCVRRSQRYTRRGGEQAVSTRISFTQIPQLDEF